MIIAIQWRYGSWNRFKIIFEHSFSQKQL